MFTEAECRRSDRSMYYIICPLGDEFKSGVWQQQEVDIRTVLQAIEPHNNYFEVEKFLIRAGETWVDNIQNV